MEIDDLIAYGAKGLVEAAARFDGRGVPFPAFARRRIYGAILDGIRAQHWFGRRADRSLRIDRAGDDWQVELVVAGQAHNDTRWNGRPMARLPFERDDAIEAALQEELRGLSPRVRRLVDLCYYRGKTLSQAAKEIGVGLPWASRLHARALSALRAALETWSHSLPPRQARGRKRSTGWGRHEEQRP